MAAGVVIDHLDAVTGRMRYKHATTLGLKGPMVE